jgi:hypothetical protein
LQRVTQDEIRRRTEAGDADGPTFQVFDFIYFRPSVAKEAKYFEGEGLSVELD